MLFDVSKIKNNFCMNLFRNCIVLVTLVFTNVVFSQLKIGGNATIISSCALLELESTNKGLLLPRMTKSQRGSISTPVAGLQIWCTDCIANGEMQLYNGTGWVSLASVPNSPTINSVSAGLSSVTISFTAPTNSYGSPITSYTVTSQPGGYYTTGTSSPLTVTGLSAGTAYTFTVVANNAKGSSISSASSAAISPN
jgi:hypothetical protein